MEKDDATDGPAGTVQPDRRRAVLASALPTFARFGYRKTSMEEVARAAGISRPGLYFLFDSKQALFRAAVTEALEDDLAEIERTLDDGERSPQERLLAAFDRWAGRYVGPGMREVTTVIDENPSLLGSIALTAPRRFEALITTAIAATGTQDAAAAAQTLISVSIGLKHQTDTRKEYLRRLETAIALVLGPATPS